MKWSVAVEAYNDAASGQPCLVNPTPDAWVLLDPSASSLERAVKGLKRCKNHSFAWWSAVESFPKSGSAEEVKGWLSGLCTALPRQGATGGWLRLLAKLREERVLLWPVGQLFLPFPGSPHFPAGRKLIFQRNVFTEYEQGWGNEVDDATVFRSMIFSMSPANSNDDLSYQGLLKVLSVFVEFCNVKRASRDAVGRSSLVDLSLTPMVLSPFRRIEGIRRGDGSIIHILADAEQILSAAGRKGAQKSRWPTLVTQSGTEPAEIFRWKDLADKYLLGLNLKREKSAQRPITRWLTYLITLERLPTIDEVARDKHIDGPTGFLAWLEATYSRASNVPARTLGGLYSFFEFCAAECAVENPLRQADIPRRNSQNNKSSKPLTPREVVQTARGVVRELINWSHLQSDGHTGPVFESCAYPGAEETGPSGMPPKCENIAVLPPTLLRPYGFEKYLVTVRLEDGSVRRVFNPVYPTLLLLMLTVPIRMIQGR